MTDKEAMAMALEALETLMIEHGSIYEKAIAALKERLADPMREVQRLGQEIEQEPVAWEQFYTTAPQRTWIETNNSVCTILRNAHDILALSSLPPRREWVGLTDAEIKAFDTWHDNREEEVGWCNPSEIVVYIDSKLKEKNT